MKASKGLVKELVNWIGNSENVEEIQTCFQSLEIMTKDANLLSCVGALGLTIGETASFYNGLSLLGKRISIPLFLTNEPTQVTFPSSI